jgi:co-chaperonin GroES (HSP10)
MSKVKLSQIKPVQAHILVRDMNFGEQYTAGGIYIPSDDGKSEGIKPRWCRVCVIGKDQTSVKGGDWIMVEHGRWTRGIEVEDDDGTVISIRRVEEEAILMCSDERPNDAEFGDLVTPRDNTSFDFSNDQRALRA